MVCVPTPAIAGLKVPVAFTPGPDQVPPVVAAVKLNEASF